MTLYFIGVNEDGKRGKMLKPFVYDTSEQNEKVQSVVGAYELSQPVLSLFIRNARLRAVNSSAYQRVRDVNYQLDLDCYCSEVTGVIDQDIHDDVVYAKRSDETTKRQFNERVQNENYMATVLYTKEEALPVKLSAKLNSEQVIALFRAGAHRRDDFDKVFNQSFKDKSLRLVANEALPTKFILADKDVFKNEQLSGIFSGVSMNRFNRGQYVLSESEDADFQMYAQTDFAQVFAQQLKTTCLALGEDVSFIDGLLPTESEISQAQAVIDRQLGEGKKVTFIDEDPTLATLQHDNEPVVVNQPSLGLGDDELAEALGQDTFDISDAIDTGVIDIDLDFEEDDKNDDTFDDTDFEDEIVSHDVFSDDDLDKYFADITPTESKSEDADSDLEI